jgi:hypothetical protein
MHTGMIASGYTVGNAAAINVSLGWYPDKVEVWNLTAGTIVTNGFLSRQSIPFSSGGTTEVTAGQRIKGATSGALAIVEAVLLYSGTWAGGDAAGFFVVRDVTGTFQSENAYMDLDDTAGIDDATITVNVTFSIKIDTAAAAVTTTSAILRYAGSTTAGIGFTIGSVVATEANLLYWIAFRADQRKNVAA